MLYNVECGNTKPKFTNFTKWNACERVKNFQKLIPNERDRTKKIVETRSLCSWSAQAHTLHTCERYFQLKCFHGKHINCVTDGIKRKNGVKMKWKWNELMKRKKREEKQNTELKV